MHYGNKGVTSETEKLYAKGYGLQEANGKALEWIPQE